MISRDTKHCGPAPYPFKKGRFVFSVLMLMYMASFLFIRINGTVLGFVGGSSHRKEYDLFIETKDLRGFLMVPPSKAMELKLDKEFKDGARRERMIQIVWGPAMFFEDKIVSFFLFFDKSPLIL